MRTIERSSAFMRDYKRVEAMPRHRECHLKPDLLLTPTDLAKVTTIIYQAKADNTRTAYRRNFKDT